MVGNALLIYGLTKVSHTYLNKVTNFFNITSPYIVIDMSIQIQTIDLEHK